MPNHWTFGRKLAAGFTAVIALTSIIVAVAVYALAAAVDSKDRVIDVHGRDLRDTDVLALRSARRTIAARGYLLSPQPGFEADMRAQRRELLEVAARLRGRDGTAERRRLIQRVVAADADYQRTLDRAVERRVAGVFSDALVTRFEEELAPRLVVLDEAIDALREHQLSVQRASKEEATEQAERVRDLIVAIAVLALVLGIAVAIVLVRGLTQQIGTATRQMQSSSAELQAVANQQLSGAKEQATAMSEITTTISELLATSRQIAESAQRVSRIAGDTASVASTGTLTVEQTKNAVGAIREQVDRIVAQMLDLGRKSQQIGGILDITNELAEQTNILAINATIEAAAAGEAGRRFAVVADEIRRLADRVGSSTKEIRQLIDEVRASVNTTVMTTETGSKAVEAGVRQFSELAGTFQGIASQVTTTTQAAKEIELSTKQQASAVEQVNVAIASAAQASRETEASSGQTLQTASELASLSRELGRLVQAPTA